jgi:hypothetical protein
VLGVRSVGDVVIDVAESWFVNSQFEPYLPTGHCTMTVGSVDVDLTQDIVSQWKQETVGNGTLVQNELH